MKFRNQIVSSFFILLVLTGCSSITGFNLFAPSDEQSVAELITYEYDEFDKDAWLSTAVYQDTLENDGGDILYHYRALYDKNNRLKFIQLYMKLRTFGWSFINDIKDVEGNKFKFSQIDREAITGNVVHETFAIIITKKQLAQFAQKDHRFKIIGDRDRDVFSVSKYVSSAFLKAVNARSQN